MTQIPPPPPRDYPPTPRGIGGGAVFVIAALTFLLGLSIGGMGGFFAGSMYGLFDNIGDSYANGNVDLAVVSPPSVRVGETFDIVVTLNNTGDRDITIATIDLWADYLDGVEIVASDPAWTDRTGEVGEYDEHHYDFTLAAGATRVVKLKARGKKPGTWANDLDVYFIDDWMPLTWPIETEVTAAP